MLAQSNMISSTLKLSSLVITEESVNSDRPKRSCKVLFLREKINLLKLTTKKESYVVFTKFSCKNEFFIPCVSF